MAWTEHGPISLPPKPLAYGAGAALMVLALLGVGLGFRASLREPGAPSLGGDIEQTGGPDQPMIAKPIVELPAPPPAATNKADSNTAQAADDSDTNAIDAQAAAARQVQAKPASQSGDIDQIMTSSSEKPQAPAKPSADEAAPGAPDASKSDVPF